MEVNVLLLLIVCLFAIKLFLGVMSSANRPFLHSSTAPTRGSGGQNTVICIKLSTRALSSFLYVCLLERNAGKVYKMKGCMFIFLQI